MRTVFFIKPNLSDFFTAVFDGYKNPNTYITSQSLFQSRLDDTFVCVQTDDEKANRVKRKLRESDYYAYGEIEHILRSNNPQKEQIAFEYLKLVIKYGKSAREKLSLPAIRAAMDEVAKVRLEVHRLHGFLRFQECENGIYYGVCSPDNDVLELLLPHFVARFKNLSFAIHDETRKKAALYNGKNAVVVAVETASFARSETEKQIVALWKKYYHTVAIPDRKNTRQMKNYMPTRYWKHLIEKDGDDL